MPPFARKLCAFAAASGAPQRLMDREHRQGRGKAGDHPKEQGSAAFQQLGLAWKRGCFGSLGVPLPLENRGPSRSRFLRAIYHFTRRCVVATKFVTRHRLAATSARAWSIPALVVPAAMASS